MFPVESISRVPSSAEFQRGPDSLKDIYVHSRRAGRPLSAFSYSRRTKAAAHGQPQGQFPAVTISSICARGIVG